MKKKNMSIRLSLQKKTIMMLNDDQEGSVFGGVTNTEALSACQTNCAACTGTPVGTIKQTCNQNTCFVSCNGGTCFSGMPGCVC
ncbi:class I lanthipeptide [Taibaiella koreensis]|uniref:class I lanthipeptide n=1 Tax=Taibaiella koreensis TaxID=1268548 RepID=UPI000E59BB84|nr:class I lanthipeptide [Taibaiella koreensis]